MPRGSEVSGMTATAAIHDEPDIVPHLHDDTFCKALRALRNLRGFPNGNARSLLVTHLLALGQIEKKRAPDDPEAESSAAKKRPLVAALQSAFVAAKEVVKQHGQRRGPLIEESWGGAARRPYGWGGGRHPGLGGGPARHGPGRGALAG